MIKAFPKIFAIGDVHIENIFHGPVEITEKVDGSQFVFGKVDNELQMRSKGKEIFIDAPEKMFQEAVDFVVSIYNYLPNNVIFYSEYLKKPKHNVIKYDRIPHNHLAVFGVEFSGHFRQCSKFQEVAKDIGLETVPVVYSGVISEAKEIFGMIERESFLGGANIEGIVVKNYAQELMIGGTVLGIASGKYVSEKFKEVHGNQWKKTHTGRGKWEVFLDSFRTEARWQKAVQHLRDNGQLENTPRDIGGLIKEVQRDITDEEEDNIKEFLWNNFGKDVLRHSIRGLPEWYKEQLAESALQATK